MELIDRERLISEKSWDAPIKDYVTGDIQCVQVVDVGDIEEFPAVDAVEVVRCKDCKHWFSNVAGYTGEEIGHCEWAGWMVGKNGYCVYGERKEELQDE